LVPFTKLEPPYEELKDLVERIWEFWGEHGKSRERVGELMQRVGLGNFLEAIEVEPVPEMIAHPRENPYVTRNTSRKRTKRRKRNKLGVGRAGTLAGRKESLRVHKQKTWQFSKGDHRWHQARRDEPISGLRTMNGSCPPSSRAIMGNGSITRF
jgi:hypothetical protein